MSHRTLFWNETLPFSLPFISFFALSKKNKIHSLPLENPIFGSMMLQKHYSGKPYFVVFLRQQTPLRLLLFTLFIIHKYCLACPREYLFGPWLLPLQPSPSSLVKLMNRDFKASCSAALAVSRCEWVSAKCLQCKMRWDWKQLMELRLWLASELLQWTAVAVGISGVPPALFASWHDSTSCRKDPN